MEDDILGAIATQWRERSREAGPWHPPGLPWSVLAVVASGVLLPMLSSGRPGLEIVAGIVWIWIPALAGSTVVVDAMSASDVPPKGGDSGDEPRSLEIDDAPFFGKLGAGAAYGFVLFLATLFSGMMVSGAVVAPEARYVAAFVAVAIVAIELSAGLSAFAVAALGSPEASRLSRELVVAGTLLVSLAGYSLAPTSSAGSLLSGFLGADHWPTLFLGLLVLVVLDAAILLVAKGTDRFR